MYPNLVSLLLFNKPFHVLSQFTTDGGKKTLADHIERPGFYPAGRLDYDSEGLLLLTDDGKLQSRISHPKYKLPKTYLVQVEGDATAEQLQQLSDGVTLKDGAARALSARRVDEPSWLWPRVPPVRERKTVPDCWLELSIDEGRNRQVRRMTAAVGLPTLRLIRTQIGPWSLAAMQPGEQALIPGPKAWSMLKQRA